MFVQVFNIIDNECGGFSRTAARCQSSKYVECASGYEGEVQLACSSDAGAFSLSGCAEAECREFPYTDGVSFPQLDDAYILFDATCGNAPALTKTACESPAYIGCNPDTHRGTVSVSCQRSGHMFEVSGCEPNSCILPKNTSDFSVPGYELVNYRCSSPSTPGTSAECSQAVTCASGFSGDVQLLCRETDNFFVLNGCVETLCEWPSDTTGFSIYDTTCGGRALTENNCNYTGFIQCQSGFEGSASVQCDVSTHTFVLSGCVDIDECSDLSHNCAAEATCTNLEGGYQCACAEGYVGNGWICNDRDECALDSTNFCAEHAICTNTVANYTCACQSGFAGDGYTCTDVTDPELSLYVNNGSTLFLGFNERFFEEDLVHSCTDAAGAATVAFVGDEVDTTLPGTYQVIITCTDETGLVVSSEVYVHVGHEQVYTAFTVVSEDLLDTGSLDTALTSAGLILTCTTSMQLKTGWHPLMVLLEFVLCDLQVCSALLQGSKNIFKVFCFFVFSPPIHACRMFMVIFSSVHSCFRRTQTLRVRLNQFFLTRSTA